MKLAWKDESPTVVDGLLRQAARDRIGADDDKLRWVHVTLTELTEEDVRTLQSMGASRRR